MSDAQDWLNPDRLIGKRGRRTWKLRWITAKTAANLFWFRILGWGFVIADESELPETRRFTQRDGYAGHRLGRRRLWFLTSSDGPGAGIRFYRYPSIQKGRV